ERHCNDGHGRDGEKNPHCVALAEDAAIQDDTTAEDPADDAAAADDSASTDDAATADDSASTDDAEADDAPVEASHGHSGEHGGGKGHSKP
ncbi:MAG: hypothetical protein QOD30_1062, partial [Actinomycetota bacterium]|nr:hypothetical protein [Actinomycetota bacterium]